MSNIPKVEAKFETTLAAKMTAAATSFVLVNSLDANGAELSGLYSFLIDGDSTSAEYISGTVSTGTVTVVGRGLDFSDGITEREGFKLEHVRGASVKITDFPLIGQIRNKLAGVESLEALLHYATDLTPSTDKHLVPKKYMDGLLAGKVATTGNETIAGIKTFSSSPLVPTPTTDMQAATKKYIDDIAIAAVPDPLEGHTFGGSKQSVDAYTPAGGATATLDVADVSVHVITMPAGNITIAISNETAGQYFAIEIIQDAVGGRTVTWFSTIKWVDGAAPTLTTTADKKDSFVFRCTGTDTYDGYIVGQNI